MDHAGYRSFPTGSFTGGCFRQKVEQDECMDWPRRYEDPDGPP